jgi:hypothetical protein
MDAKDGLEAVKRIAPKHVFNFAEQMVVLKTTEAD